MTTPTPPSVTNVTQEMSTRKNAVSTTAQLVRRRHTAAEQDQILQAVLDESGGVCTCCAGRSSSLDRPHLDWEPYQRSDDGGPLLRGALCRSCKMALNRYVDGSKYQPTDLQMLWLTAYLQRPLRTAFDACPRLRQIVVDGTPSVTSSREWLEATRARLTGQSS